MGNTNFQTFHQMGSAINDFVRQATGRDNVQNIDIEHITVAQNHYYEEMELRGPMVSFRAGAAGIPLEKCLVKIDPVQDLHGYDAPWPGGGMGNLADPSTFTLDSLTENNGVYTASDNDTASSLVFKIQQYNGDSFISGAQAQTSAITTAQRIRLATTIDASATRLKFANSGVVREFRLFIPLASSLVGQTVTFSADITDATIGSCKFKNIQLEIGNIASPVYYPYSNICPISGWDGVNVYVSPTTDAADGRTYSIAFPSDPGTVYGGTLDAVTGGLVVDRMVLDLGDANWTMYPVTQGTLFRTPAPGSNLPYGSMNYIVSDYRVVHAQSRAEKTSSVGADGNIDIINSDYADAAAFKNAMAGQMAVYPLASPVTYQLTPQQIETLLGPNNIWADTGDIDIKFTNIKGLF